LPAAVARAVVLQGDLPCRHEEILRGSVRLCPAYDDERVASKRRRPPASAGGLSLIGLSVLDLQVVVDADDAVHGTGDLLGRDAV
jgi:hypothetical protein